MFGNYGVLAIEKNKCYNRQKFFWSAYEDITAHLLRTLCQSVH